MSISNKGVPYTLRVVLINIHGNVQINICVLPGDLILVTYWEENAALASQLAPVLPLLSRKIAIISIRYTQC
jgi:hypothetical protein